MEEKINDWWKKENETPVLMINATEVYKSRHPLTRSSKTEKSEQDTNINKFWFDLQLRIKSFAEGLQYTYYGSEAYPYFFVDFGPGLLAGFLGGELKFDFKSMWIESSLEDYDEMKKLELDKNSYYWKKVEEMTELALERCDDKFLVSITDIGGIMDVLSGMRGSNQFLRDLVQRPQQVKEALEKIKDAWFETFEYFSDRLLSEQECMVAWNGIYSEKPTYTPQNDMSCMISPERFREFSLGNIEEITKRIERTVYHLDGPGALRHLDDILSLEDLNAVQWVPGAGAPGGNARSQDSEYAIEPGLMHWIDYLKKIQDAGKSLELWVNPNDVKPLMEELDPEGLLMKVDCKTEREAKKLERKGGKLP
ncbi:hypothetical protein AKJ41_02725 [candidate division MSBL1 archaeon SCGC-AAA259O05]|uniref:Uncharacterized protein n=1 Tax=candidate division MSBL1 archaeon SCGC-AAA259O05 TaxID=1698271 RepID=A0A133V3T2_9EURY|nr:hypothetical protein AKJ41_02725 [candidate division MSBL1 archaeon SCGC-AAA259O05]